MTQFMDFKLLFILPQITDKFYRQCCFIQLYSPLDHYSIDFEFLLIILRTAYFMYTFIDIGIEMGPVELVSIEFCLWIVIKIEL